MKRTPALTIVIALSVAVPASAQQEVAPGGPLRLSKQALTQALIEATRDAVRQGAPIEKKGGDWTRVRRLASGTEIAVKAATVAGSYEVLAVDDGALTVLNSEGLKSSVYSFQIRGLAVADPKALARVAQGGTVSGDRVRITPDGVFIENRKVMEAVALLVRIPRDEVTEVVAAVTRGSTTAAGWGVLLGLYCSVSSALTTEGSRGSKLLLIGTLPVLFGMGTYHSFASTQREVIYRR